MTSSSSSSYCWCANSADTADALMLLILLMRWCCLCCWCAEAAVVLMLLMLLMRWCCWCTNTADAMMLLMRCMFEGACYLLAAIYCLPSVPLALSGFPGTFCGSLLVLSTIIWYFSIYSVLSSLLFHMSDWYHIRSEAGFKTRNGPDKYLTFPKPSRWAGSECV